MDRCEVHYYNIVDGHCSCEDIRKEIDELKEKFWNEWQETAKDGKLAWVHDNLPYFVKDMISMKNGIHILECIDSMVASLCGKHPGGDFVEAVLNNDLMATLDRADDVNEIVLKTYMLFLYNKVPCSLRRNKY